MSDDTEADLTPRLEEFRKEVDGLALTGGAANPERTGSTAGIVLFVVGLAVAAIGALTSRGDTGAGDATAMLSEIVSSNNGIIVVALGLTLAIVGGMIWLRNSLTRYLRYWLVRLIYEDRSNTDRLIEAIERSKRTDDT